MRDCSVVTTFRQQSQHLVLALGELRERRRRSRPAEVAEHLSGDPGTEERLDDVDHDIEEHGRCPGLPGTARQAVEQNAGSAGPTDSGDTLKDGIGAMNDARIGSFFDKMARAGVARRDIDYRKSYTLRFINKGVGLDLKKK